MEADKMRAAVLTGPLTIEMKDVPIPELNDEEVLIEVLACGICTTDIELYDGTMSYLHNGMSSLPIIMGHEWCGTVVKMGKDVEGFNIGEKVVGDVSIGCGKCRACMRGDYHLCDHRREIGVIHYDGAFAEYLKVPYKNLYHVDESVSPLTAMFVEPAATSVRAADRARVTFGDDVIVNGDGTIGLFAAQAAKCYGAARVCVVGILDDHKELVESWGMDFCNSAKEDIRDFITREWGREDADVIIESSGQTELIDMCIDLIRAGGTICQVSFSGRTVSLSQIDMIPCRDLTLVGTLASPNYFGKTMKMMATGGIHVDGMLTQKYTLEQCPEAFEYVQQKKGPRIKVGVLKNLDIQ